jgi:uracil phosphoribosyltransferase
MAFALPKAIHVVAAIACSVGIAYVQRAEPTVKIWCAAIDEELTAKGYIVPGLGDAGDLAFGEKIQM